MKNFQIVAARRAAGKYQTVGQYLRERITYDLERKHR